MAFTDLRKDELVEAARYYKVDIEHDYTKAQIATVLLDAGKSPEQWEADREAYVNGEPDSGGAITTADLKGEEPADEPAEEEPADEPAKPAKNDDLILVRFTGRQRSYQVGRFKFDQSKPFALMSKDELDRLNRSLFREATKAEAAEFYN